LLVTINNASGNTHVNIQYLVYVKNWLLFVLFKQSMDHRVYACKDL